LYWRRQYEDRNAYSVVSPVLDEDRMTPDQWLELLLCVTVL